MNLEITINNAFQKLKKNNIKSALLDSEILLSKAINKSREFIILNLKYEINKKDYYYFQNLINQRSKGKPIAYLTSKKFFWKYEFLINDKVLIPRPDSEIVIENVLSIYKKKNNISFLDIGFGSGCIMLSILKERKDFKATGVDISGNALKVCNINAYKLGVKNRTRLFKSDIDKFLIGKYDLIISNPPYIKKLDLKYLEKDIINFEPKIALDGGLDGISEIRKIIIKSSELIKNGGKLILEIAYNQKEEVKQLLRKNSFYINSVVKDLANNDRCIISTKIERYFMVTFRNNHNNRRNNFRRNDRNFKSNSDRPKFVSNFSNNDNFKRKAPGRNNHNAPKLIEKYNDLAREASSNGDKILSENYLQHADHFTRILNERESFKREKVLENRSENISDNAQDINNSSEKNLLEKSSDESKIQKTAKSQININ